MYFFDLLILNLFNLRRAIELENTTKNVVELVIFQICYRFIQTQHPAVEG